MSTLEIRDIRKQYGSLETLKGIDIELDSGEFLVLLGPSGCGKSTLLNIIAGLAEPSGGDIHIGGKSVVGIHPKDRDIAMVFQSYALYPNLSVGRNIGFGLEMRKVPAREREASVLETAKLLHIDHLLDRKPSQLSGGQRQRVAIGRALVRNPRIFLFDEPLSNLDAKLRMEMRTELKRLHQMLKTTVVYVTHDQIEAMTLATRIAVMRDGRIEQLGRPEEIYNRPATLYVAGFVGSPPMNFLDAVREGNALRIAGSDVHIPVPPGPADRTRDRQKLTLGLRPEALRLGSQQDRPSLQATVEVVELTGPELVVTCKVGDQRLLACLPATARLEPGASCIFQFEHEEMHVFDSATEQALL